VSRIEVLAIENIASNHIHDAAAAAANITDVQRCLLGEELSSDPSSITLHENNCLNRDVVFPLQLAGG
jgi:hypothetical protein